MKYTNRTLVISFVFPMILLMSCTKNITHAEFEVIPLPQKIEKLNGQPFILNQSTRIVYTEGDEDLKRIANFLSEYIKFSTGKSLTVSDKGRDKNCIILRTGFSHLNREAYSIQVTNANIIVEGASPAGVFYAIQTIRKSIDAYSDGKNVSFPQAYIEDYPRMRYRGMMLDVGRHMFPVEFIKEYIDILALHNINRFHWHLTEDQGWRIEIKKYPELTKKGSQRKETVIGRNSGKYDGKPYGGFYTQEEAKEIVAYAKDRFITVIPEIDMPGHMIGALTAYPNLGCTGGTYEVITEWGVFDDVLCAGNDEVLVFLENVFTEIIDIFPSEYIHIGGDECPKTRWEKCPKCQARIKALGLKAEKGHTAEEKLQSYIISYVENFLNNKGRKIIGWDEILEGGLAPNATVMSWRGIEGAIAAAKQGNDAIMTPTSHCYFDYYQTLNTEAVPLAIGGYTPLEKVYSFEPIPEALTTEEAKHIIGVQANMWTEYIPTSQQVEYMLMPRIDALSEVQWSLPERKNYDLFLKRLLNMLKHYDKKGYNYSKSTFDVKSDTKANMDKGVIELTLSTIDGAPIYYTTDGTTPTEKSEEYTGTLVFSDPVKIKAIAFRPTMQTLVYSETFDINKATLKPIRLNQVPHRSYTFGGATALVDGVSGNPGNYKDGSWIGFTKDDVVMYIDLKETIRLSSAEINTYVCTGDWIFGAKGIEVAVSNDEKTYRIIAKESFPTPTEHIEKVIPVKINFEPTQTRYVKVTINKEAKIPAWHPGVGNPPFIFIDEIKLN